jgi:hypothetical protein
MALRLLLEPRQPFVFNTSPVLERRFLAERRPTRVIETRKMIGRRLFQCLVVIARRA